MILDQFARNLEYAGTNGFASRPTGFAEMFSAQVDVATAPSQTEALLNIARAKRYEDATTKFSTATGRPLKSPLNLLPAYVDQVNLGRVQDPFVREALDGLDELSRLDFSKVKEAYRGIVDRELLGARLMHPVIPDPAEFDAQIAADVRRREERAARVASGAGAWGHVGGFLGGVAGTMAQPEQAALTVLTLPVGGVGGSLARTTLGRILGTAAIEGGLGAGQQALVEGLSYGTRPSIGLPAKTAEEIAVNILYAGAGGAILGGGLRAGAEAVPYVWPGLRAVATRASVLGSGGRLSAAASDALRVLESELQVATTGPGAGLSGHAAAVEAAMQAVVDGERPNVGRRVGDPSLDAAIYDRARALAEETGGDLTTGRLQQEFGIGYPEARRILNRLQREDLAAVKGASPAAGPISERRANIYTSAGRGIEIEYQVVEADHLLASHGADLEVDPAYPAELQPRDRGRAASAAQIQDIAANLEPERLATGSDAGTGAPVVGPDDAVESGNGRLLAMRRAYAEMPDRAAAYRAHLADLGFQVDGMSRPVLIRRRITPLSPEERVAFVREANLAAVARLSSVEQALTDAKLLSDRALDLYRGGDVELVANRDFVRAFADSLPQSEHAALVTAGGELSKAGADRIRAAMLAKAYGDATLLAKFLEATEINIAAIGRALTDIAPAWAQMRARAARGEIVPAMDATADLLAAVRLIDRARQQGMKVSDFVGQGELFDSGVSDTAKGFLRAMFNDAGLARASGRERIVDRLRHYVEEANKTVPGPGLFGDAPVTPAAILSGPTLSLRPIAEAGDAALLQVGKASNDDALAAEAARLLAERDVEVPIAEVVENGQRKAVTKSAREIVQEFDRQIESLQFIKTCAVG